MFDDVRVRYVLVSYDFLLLSARIIFCDVVGTFAWVPFFLKGNQWYDRNNRNCGSLFLRGSVLLFLFYSTCFFVSVRAILCFGLSAIARAYGGNAATRFL